MAFADAAGEVTVLKRMIQVVMRIVGAAVVPDPFVAGRVDMRSFGMSRFVGELWMFGWRGSVRFGRACRSGTVGGNVAAANAANGAAVLPAPLLC